MMLSHLKSLFGSSSSTADLASEDLRIKLVVASFEDECLENSGKILAQFLATQNFLDVIYYETAASGALFYQDGRNFFDFFDGGKQILDKTKANVLIRGFCQDDKICLSFQAPRQYDKLNLPVILPLNRLYLPLRYFQEKNMPASLSALISGIVVALAKVENAALQMNVLEKIVADISKQRSPEGLNLSCMPYILNALSLVYLQAVAENLKMSDVKTISALLENARKYQPATKDILLCGNIYANLGQLYQCAAEKLNHHKYTFYKNAAVCCRYAQKYFNRYSYPYDFGFLSYRLSQIYYGYWKQSSDIQALRDAVFHLREAEKIFTVAIFPYFWAEIQGNLGLYLSLLGLFSGNDEISMLAVDNYKKRQKIYMKEKSPQEWAKAEANIGNVFYNSGKKHDDEEYLEEAIKYYNRAAEIYENGKMSAELKQMQICMAKTDEYIMRLNRK